MNDDFVSLYAYNRWADRKTLVACGLLTAEQYVAEPAPGWSSVRSTVVHLAIVTEGWMRGVAGQTVDSLPIEAEMQTVHDAAGWFDRAYHLFDDLVPTMTPEWLATARTFQGRGRSAVLPPWVVLRHLVNHATYHRGQIASKLKQFGVEAPATDLVFWAFEQIPQGG